MKEVLKKSIDKILKDLEVDGDYSVGFTSNSSFGDLTSNVAMVTFSKVKSQKLKVKSDSPREYAQYIADRLKINADLKRIFTDIKVEGPGFINFWLKPQILAENLELINTDIDKTSRTNKTDKPRNIMVEYAHPNTHKEFHVGHLRTLLIGESLSRLFHFQGDKVFRANYQGDIGPHVAKAIYGVKKLMDERNLSLVTLSTKTVWQKAEFLQEAYIRGNKDYENSKDEIDEINNKLYKGSHETKELYDTTRIWSLDYFKAIYDIFNVNFDRLFFESETSECGKKIVLENTGKVFRDDSGTIVFDGDKFGLHKRVFVTKNGNPTYEGKDMCLAFKQFEIFPFDKNIHVVAVEQKEYFKVIFKALELIDPKFAGREQHLSMGMVNLVGKKMSSRTGEIVSAKELFDLVREEVEKLVGSGRVKVDEKKDTIDKITKAAIIYAYLKVNPTLNLTFDIKTSISLDGDSGPYLLYTYARIKSILRKAKENYELRIKNYGFKNEDINLLRTLYRFGAVVEEAAANMGPNILANYLYDLASEFNNYYQKVPVLKAESQALIEARLALISAVSLVLKKGLELLDIKAVEKM